MAVEKSQDLVFRQFRKSLPVMRTSICGKMISSLLMILFITACSANGAKWTPTFGDSNTDKDKWINWNNEGIDYGTLVSTVNGKVTEIRVAPGSSEKFLIKWDTDGFTLIHGDDETKVKNDRELYFGYNIDLYDTSLSSFWIETETGKKIYEIKVQ